MCPNSGWKVPAHNATTGKQPRQTLTATRRAMIALAGDPRSEASRPMRKLFFVWSCILPSRKKPDESPIALGKLRQRD